MMNQRHWYQFVMNVTVFKGRHGIFLSLKQKSFNELLNSQMFFKWHVVASLCRRFYKL